MNVFILEYAGFASSIEAMRLPHKSKGDSFFDPENDNAFVIGKKDLELATKLCNAGDEHAKFLRGITAWLDIKAPRYWWQEMDTYRIGTESLSSESTMHTITKDDLSSTDFAGEPSTLILDVIDQIKQIRTLDISDGEKLVAIKQILPESFLQRRIRSFSYQTLRRIYKQRKSHRLVEWRLFCTAIESLPYAEDFIIS